jgi:hypothetical protein
MCCFLLQRCKFSRYSHKGNGEADGPMLSAKLAAVPSDNGVLFPGMGPRKRISRFTIYEPSYRCRTFTRSKPPCIQVSYEEPVQKTHNYYQQLVEFVGLVRDQKLI